MKNEDLPTLGRPTIPAFKLLPGLPNKAFFSVTGGLFGAIYAIDEVRRFRVDLGTQNEEMWTWITEERESDRYWRERPTKLPNLSKFIGPARDHPTARPRVPHDDLKNALYELLFSGMDSFALCDIEWLGSAVHNNNL